MKYECTVPGFEDSWADVVGFWSRKQLREWFAPDAPEEIDADAPEEIDADGFPVSEHEYCAKLRTRVTACHLQTIDGSDDIDDPAEITPQAFDERLDDELATWMAYLVPASYENRSKLGEVHGRNLFTSTEPASS